MKLSRVERWVLANQFRILELLDSENADYFRRSREAIEHGYEGEYSQLAQAVYDDKDCLTEDQCLEVLKTLSMFQTLRRSYEDLGRPSEIDEHFVTFSGYDGNDEATYVMYCRYVCDPSAGKFQNIPRGDDFNSHMPRRDVYRRMLAAYDEIPVMNRGALTKEEIISVIKAAPDPDSEYGKAMREGGTRH